MNFNILIVDDIKENVYAMEVLLEDLHIDNDDLININIFVAYSGEEALRVTLKDEIDLILLDIRMPGMDGFEVAKNLKLIKRTANIPVIFLTAEFKSEEFERQGYEVGALDYFIKPIERYQFLNKLKLYINLFLASKVQKKEFDDTLASYMNLMDKHVISSDTDLDGKITRVSSAFCNITGYRKEELIGKTHRMLRSPNFDEKIYADLHETIAKNRIWKGELENINKYGEEFWVEIFIYPVYDKKHQKIGYTSVRNDISSRKKLELISITDSLTGLYNRRYFDQIAPKIIRSSKRLNRLVCFALMDIDHFKLYNDNYGHQMGDEVLKRVSKSFLSFMNRADDFCFRIGGEEFCIIFYANDIENACKFVTKIRKGVENLSIEHNHSKLDNKNLTISVGLTCERAEDIDSVEGLYEDTDRLLYEAKSLGRNRIRSNHHECDESL